MEIFDLAIIGAGAGGLSLAAGAAQLGLNVALFEQSLMGGDCLNYGCVPSKSLIAAAKNYWRSQHSQALGLEINDASINFKQVMRHVREVIERLSVHDSCERFTSLGVTVIKQQAQFLNANTIQAGDKEIRAKYFVVATGSSPSIPPIPGIELCSFLTNETIFELQELPAHLLVIGGGPIGCELAQAFAMLGAKVSLIEAGKILAKEDVDAVALARKALIKTGISLFENSHIANITSNEGRITINLEYAGEIKSITGSHLLVATGRKPNIGDLHCDKAGIEVNQQGICVDDSLRSTNRKIFAIGDAAGRLQFTHVANYHAGIVLRRIAFKLPAKISKLIPPRVCFTYPEIAQAGFQEQDIPAMKHKIKIVQSSYAENDRAQTELATEGLIKVLVNKKGTILGATIIGENAGELILPWAIAIREGKTLRTFTDQIIPYPTLNELSKRVAGQFYAPKLFSPLVKKLVHFLKRF